MQGVQIKITNEKLLQNTKARVAILASGLDSIIESKDMEQCLETLLTLKLINGGYKEKYWDFEEGIEKHIKLAQKGNARNIG